MMTSHLNWRPPATRGEEGDEDAGFYKNFGSKGVFLGDRELSLVMSLADADVVPGDTLKIAHVPLEPDMCLVLIYCERSWSAITRRTVHKDTPMESFIKLACSVRKCPTNGAVLLAGSPIGPLVPDGKFIGDYSTQYPPDTQMTFYLKLRSA